tara:strand:- start:508 stop:621 length:114 start_codon:yes stop_codon:yes gene_type:complete
MFFIYGTQSSLDDLDKREINKDIYNWDDRLNDMEKVL